MPAAATTNGKRLGNRRDQITAAAIRLDDLGVGAELLRQLGKQEKWQALSLGFYDTIGEVHYGVTMSADALAKGRLYVAARPEPDAERVPADDPDSGVPLQVAELAAEKLRELRAPVGGQAQIIRAAAMNTQLTGEWYLLFHDDPGGPMHGWHVRSVEDVKVSADKIEVDGLGEFRSDDVSRVWNPHPRKFSAADCGMRGVLSQCETVLLCDRQFRAGLRSRLFAGLLLLSNDFRVGTGSPDESTANAGDGEATDDPILQDILMALSTGIQDEGSASAVVPNTLYGSTEAVQNGARLLSFAQQVDAQVMALREQSLRRVAQGLDMPPEIVLGVGDVSHWAQWFIGESFVQHVEPKATFLEDAFTQVFLRPELEREGIDPEILDRLEVAIDLSPLMRRPNGDEDAKHAYSVGELNGEGLRRALAISEEFAPTPEDDVRWLILNKAQFGQSLTTELLRREITPDLPDVAPDGAPPAGAPAGPGTEDEPNSPPVAAAAGSTLLAIDAALTERLFAAALAAFRRALEKAGNRAKSKVTASYKASVRGVKPEQVISTLGPTLMAAAGITEDELLDGALAQLRNDFDRWVSAAQAAALAAAIAMAPEGADGDTVDEFEARQADDREAAWVWFSAAAAALLRQRMADGADLAEWEVRALVRQSLARAGGATELSPASAGGATDVPETAGLGLATGVAMIGLLTTLGVALTSWEWVHGEPDHPFPEHVDLNGRVEQSPDDFDGNHPGDHEGCTCALEPKLEVPT